MTFFRNTLSPRRRKFIAQDLAIDYATSTFTFDPPFVGAYSVASGTVTISGISPGDILDIYRPTTLSAGLVLAGTNITANNTLTIYIGNITAGAIDDIAQIFSYQWIDLT